MKKSLFKKLFLSSSVLAACSICLLTNLNNHSSTSVIQMTRNDNSFNDVSTNFNSDQKWIDDIKEAATSAKDSGNIQIFFTRNASLLYQQSLISLLYLFDNTSTSFSENSTSESETIAGGVLLIKKLSKLHTLLTMLCIKQKIDLILVLLKIMKILCLLAKQVTFQLLVMRLQILTLNPQQKIHLMQPFLILNKLI